MKYPPYSPHMPITQHNAWHTGGTQILTDWNELVRAVFKCTKLLPTLDFPNRYPFFFPLPVLAVPLQTRCWCAPPGSVMWGEEESESLLPSSRMPWPRVGLGDRLAVSVSLQAGCALSRLAGQSLKSEVIAGQVARKESGKQGKLGGGCQSERQRNRGTCGWPVGLKKRQTDQYS